MPCSPRYEVQYKVKAHVLASQAFSEPGVLVMGREGRTLLQHASLREVTSLLKTEMEQWWEKQIKNMPRYWVLTLCL